MSSVLAGLQRVLHPTLPVRIVFQRTWQVRAIHATPAALKKKQQSSESVSDAEDLFGQSAEHSDSLFSDHEPTSTKRPAPQASQLSQDIPPHNPSVPASRQYDRNARFEELYQFARACLVTKAETKRQVRSSIWNHLFQLASTPEQLDRVAEMFPKWRDAHRTFRPSTVVVFAARCHALRCPGLALKVFGNHPKYGVDLNLDAAQLVLHSMHRWRRHQDIITFATLFSIYGLPPVSSDLLSNALLLKALLGKPTDESTAVANAMVPSLQRLLEKTDPQTMIVEPRDRRLSNSKKTWLAFALKRIENVLQSQGIEHGWLARWMDVTGYHTITASA
ncbi:hypothetical protein DICSQDRAFT_161775 [Dichomitus squalens LYAD-421 SS1]|uniref:Uncharacterized protein n=2 Tax=Dichomitus squalens TaxID=114155 RepID=A0A4Q9M762_9APHY|nr:uncharacterized protein DICSQDRAFT_161775 [Dichomitus squalens LYAD-421 SS1]EJF61040.1 hypothetical protein DICSQDRAFT_161775 [Dichomitus squalens LYAD-421 SS1]TBU22884.1 hypothetical protein BD311DRAFT_769625 [Dichomitus squalens]